jgi:hypothetical protein
VLAANAAALGSDISSLLAAADPAIAAITALSPSDACALATERSLRYAVQCWDEAPLGKCVLWKPSLDLLGLYRLEFTQTDLDGDFFSRGLLRVALRWDGRPLHVFAAQFAPDATQTRMQFVQTAREAEAFDAMTIVAADGDGVDLPDLPGYVDCWSAAHHRTFAMPSTVDLGAAARAAFGIGTSTDLGVGASAPLTSNAGVRVYSTADLAVRSSRRWAGALGPVTVDVDGPAL